MRTLIKIAVSVGIILLATTIAKRFPSAAGLVGVMPLTGALVLVWVYLENRGDPAVMGRFTEGALWGMLPTGLFFLTAFFCFRKEFALPTVLLFSFAAWFAAACIHQWVLK